MTGSKPPGALAPHEGRAGEDGRRTNRFFGGLAALLGFDQAAAAKALFDADYYRSHNEDVAAAGVDPFTHYMQYGWIEGRDPSASFSTLFYRDANIPGQALNPLAHYADQGRARTATPTRPASADAFAALQRDLVAPVFSIPFYLSQIETLDGDPIRHYLLTGWRRRVLPFEGFDADKVLDEHSFIAALDVSPLYYAQSQARLRQALSALNGGLDDPTEGSESFDAPPPPARLGQWGGDGQPAPFLQNIADFSERLIAPHFDADYYLAVNHDVREAGLDPLTHFCRYGWQEGRSPNRLFDVNFYGTRQAARIPAGTNPFIHYLTVGRGAGLKPNSVGYRLYPPLREPDAADWAGVKAAPLGDDAECVVVMPVYKGRDETLAAIHAVLAAPQQTRFALHILDDCSPDRALSAKLDALAQDGLFHLEVNQTNLGFVRSVNKALRQHGDRPVILLNTDAKVSGDWIDRLMAHAAADPTIATVTPLSNNATIFSYPGINRNNNIEPELDAAGLDRLARECNAGRRCDVPVGVGFCFLMSSESRRRIGLFDEDAFGRGYGEENDFCLRAAKAGFRNVAAEDVFVYHVGEVSFGKADASKSAPGQKALISKHPEYPELIGSHLHADQLEDGRLRLDLRRIAEDAGPASAIVIYHAATGGIITHVKEQEAALANEGIKLVHLRVGISHRWGVEVRAGWSDAPHCPNLPPMPFNRLASHLVDFLGWLNPRFIHVHSLVGFDWQATLGLMALIRNSAVPYRFTLHDYSVVCHRNDLVQPTGHYCGLPRVGVCRACVANDRTYPEAVDPRERRSTFERFLEGAEIVFAPSRDIGDRLHRAGARYDVQVQPHLEPPVARPIIRPDRHRIGWDVVTVGAIGPHKGSRILLGLARDAAARDLPLRYTIIGYSDVPRETAAAGIVETGRYLTDEDAHERIAAIDPAFILLPSIWPETFCYTLSMAFALDVLPVVFDLGAQAERIRARQFGEVLPYALTGDLGGMNDRLLALAQLRQPRSQPTLVEQARNSR